MTWSTVHYHAVVWLDHHEARIIHFNADAAEEEVVRPTHPPRHLHVKAGSASGTHITTDAAFFHDVAAACAAVPAVLLLGPSSAKTELMAYLHQHAPQTVKHIVGVETLAHVTDPQLLAAGRRFFAHHGRTAHDAQLG
jgi:stalled ribosome rescue protein Dom34